MSAEASREFVDANVLVYAFDASAGHKKTAAEQLLSRLWKTGSGCLSVQVLQEFFVTITRKVPQPLEADEAAERIGELGAWSVFSPTTADVIAAIAIQEELQLAFWDAMIVQAAAELGCNILWTEDLNHGQMMRGVLIRDPFGAVLGPSDSAQ